MPGRISALTLIALIALAGCKGVRVERGEVPDQYRAQALNYMGAYAGPNGALKVSLVGRAVQLAYADKAGHEADLLDPRCESRIGKLQTVTLTPTGSLQSAVFAFNPNRCWGSVDGRTLTLDFATNRVRTSILIHGADSKGCRIDAGNPRNGTAPHQVCGEDRAIYSSKLFRK